MDFCNTEKFVVSAGIQTPLLPAHSLATVLNSSSSSPECYREDKNFSPHLRIEKKSSFSTLYLCNSVNYVILLPQQLKNI